METNPKSIESESEREIAITRIFDAPRELMWNVWTDPKHIALWWGPNGFTNTIHQMDVKPGGVWSFIMHGPDGVDYPNRIVYVEVKKPERLVYNHGNEDQPDHFLVTVTFEDHDGKTRLHMQMLFNTRKQRDEVVEKYGAKEGLRQNMDRLLDYLGRLGEKTWHEREE